MKNISHILNLLDDVEYIYINRDWTVKIGN